MTNEWSKTTKHIVGVGLVLFGLYILYLSRAVLGLLIIASLIAFLLMPIVGFFRKRLKLPRGLAVLLAYLLLLILLLLGPLLLVPPVMDGLGVITGIDYQILVNDTFSWITETLQNLSTVESQFFGFTIELSTIANPALDYLNNARSGDAISLPSYETIFNSIRSALTVTLDVAASVAGTVFSGVLTFILTLLYSVYLTLNAHKLAPAFLRVVPLPYRPEIATLLARLRRIWRAYFRGQLALMTIIGLITLIGNTAIGLPGAFTLAVIAGLLEMIPNLGPILAAIPAVVVALIQGSTMFDVSNLIFALIVIALYTGIQQLENTFIVPRILGEAVELHPLVVMVGVVIGASVAGILGALLAAPVIASGREILSYLYAKILSEDPFPPQPEKSSEKTTSWLEQGKQLVTTGQTLASRLLQRSSPSDSQAAEVEISANEQPSSQDQNKP